MRPHLQRSSSLSSLAGNCLVTQDVAHVLAPPFSAQHPGLEHPSTCPHQESLLELLASEGINQGVHNGTADDEGQEEVGVLEDALAGGVLRTEDDE